MRARPGCGAGRMDGDRPARMASAVRADSAAPSATA